MTEEPPQDAVISFPACRRYEAFKESGSEVPRLLFRAGDGLLSVPYAEIGAVVLPVITGDELSFSIGNRHDVTIRGRNLRPLLDAIHRQGCAVVQEFDAREFLAPDAADQRAAFVERIDISERRAGAPPPPAQPGKA